MIAAVWIPDFSLQAWIRGHESVQARMMGLVESGNAYGSNVLLALTPDALSQGIRVGMTVAQARTRCAEIQIVSRHSQSETSAQDAMRDVLWGRSPQVFVAGGDEAGWAYVETRGLMRLFGTLKDWVEILLDDLRSISLQGSVGVAPGWQQARILAFAGGGILDESQGLEVFYRMPCAALEPTKELLTLFRRLGMSTIGDFLRIDAADVLEHMGEEAFLKHQIVRGEEPGGPLCFERNSFVFEEKHCLEEAIGELEPLFFLLRPLIERVLSRLSIRGYYCRALVLHFAYEGVGSEERVVVAGCPTRSVKILFELCRLSLERAPPADAVEVLRVKAELCQVESVQLDFFHAREAPLEEISLTVARLEGVFGEDNVGTPSLLSSHREDAFEVRPFGLTPTTEQQDDCVLVPSICLRRFRPPREARVLCRENRLLYLFSDVCSGRISQWYGPYRTCGEWWKDNDGAKQDGRRGFFCDLYDVEVKNTMYRVSWDHQKHFWQALGWYD